MSCAPLISVELIADPLISHRMYPLDVIKSRLQTDGLPSQAGTPAKKYAGAVDCARQLWKEAGVKGFFRGLTPTMIRSPVVNGVTFAVFETTMRLIT